MTPTQQLIAYLATLGAIVAVVLCSMVISTWNGGVLIGKLEAFGLGTVLGGLIGVLRIPSIQRPAGAADQVDPQSQGEK